MLDGTVGVAVGMLARDLAAQSRHWCLLPDNGGDPAVKLAGDVLGTEQLLDLRLGLGEGATALAVLPLLQGALTLASTLTATSAPAAGSSEPEEKPALEDSFTQAASSEDVVA
jgi:hypothetical protein